MQYEKLPKITKDEAEAKLKVAQGEDLCLLLLSMCELEDWKWVQDIYLLYARDKDNWVASSAITGIGHLARITGDLEKEKVISTLKEVSRINPKLRAKIHDAISDINMFV